jgi:protein-S-isoprenylcysteine O-methyltransferase
MSIVVFLLTEFIFRKKGESGSLATSDSDKGSTRLVVLSFGFSILLLVVLSILKYGFFGLPLVDYLGLVVMVIGLSLRFWSMNALGKFYSRTLRTMSEQRVITTGPYKLVRHPGYLSSILIWIGTGLAIENWIMTLSCLIIFSLVYSYRIVAEEKMLVSIFGKEYEEYRKKSWRLIPLLF